MKITDEIFQVGGAGFTAPEDAAVYLICFDGRTAVIDTGCGNSTQRLLKNIRACKISDDQIDYILLTHCHFDHTGGVLPLKKYLTCPVLAHELDAVFLEKGDASVTAASWYGADMKAFEVDIKLSGSREFIRLGNREIEAIHVPGHSPGSLVFMVESDKQKVLFGQDVHGPLSPTLKSNGIHYRKSLELMLSLDADILCEGHYGVLRGKDQVREFIRSFLMDS